MCVGGLETGIRHNLEIKYTARWHTRLTVDYVFAPFPSIYKYIYTFSIFISIWLCGAVYYLSHRRTKDACMRACMQRDTRAAGEDRARFN